MGRYNRLPDAFVVEGPMAGGHLGFSSEQLRDPEYSLEKIIPEVVEAVSLFEKEHGVAIPIIAAGGIYSGADIDKFMKLGAAGVQMGTRFVATYECDASPKFKQCYVDSRPEDLIIIESPVGLPGQAVRNPFAEMIADGTVPKPETCDACLKHCSQSFCIIKALIRAQQGDVETGLVFTGENVYKIDKILPVKELIAKLVKEAEETE